jgi:uncharacterized protein with LGFP repeats
VVEKKKVRSKRGPVLTGLGGLLVATTVMTAPAALADTFTSPATGAHDVVGDILAEYRTTGGAAGTLGFPTTNELPTPRSFGRFNHFQNGSIYWSPGTGAHAVKGAIGGQWAFRGWENGSLGFPVIDEVPVSGGAGQHFQGGSIYWSGSSGAHQIGGAIRDKWASIGWERSDLGFPTTDELPTPNGRGAYNAFTGGSIYWSPSSGAQAVRGAIRDKWGTVGWENGPLGFPTTSETPVSGGAANHFQGGSIYWSPSTGAHIVGGAVRDKWASMGWERSSLGYPTSEEIPTNYGVKQTFANGALYFSAADGRVYTAEPVAPSVSQKNAVAKAQQYLQVLSFSRSGLIDQLEYEGFSFDDATYGVDHLDVDWYAQAAKKAKQYLSSQAFSHSGLVAQLQFEGFTADQAEFGVRQAGL